MAKLSPGPTGPPDAPRVAPRAAVDLLQQHQSGDSVPLSPQESRHLVSARRLGEGDVVEAFNAETGLSASAVIEKMPGGWTLRLTATPSPAAGSMSGSLTVYAAVPKGQRADWMAEKLAEFGVSRWVPLIARRSVVEPGDGKLARWRRLALEAAKQSRAPAAMQIDSPVSLDEALQTSPPQAIVLSTERQGEAFKAEDVQSVFIGPEGGWDASELSAFEQAGVRFATLGTTVLRVETAALAVAAIWSASRSAGRKME